MNLSPRIAVAGAALMLAPGAAVAPRREFELSLTGQPRSWAVECGAYAVGAHGGARWGMSMDEVMALVCAAYPFALAGMKEELDPMSGQRTLSVAVAELPPGPGPAAIAYVFGARSQRLIAMHLLWGADGDPEPARRLQLVQAATRLAGGVVGYRWPARATTRGMVIGDGAVIVFSGRDGNGGGIEIRLDGVALDVERPRLPGQPLHRPAPHGPARLCLSLVASTGQRDIYDLPARHGFPPARE